LELAMKHIVLKAASQHFETKMKEYKWKHWIISEKNKYKRAWDVYCLLLVLYVAIVLPYRIGLGLEDTKFTR
jgi:hypothetical protein